MTTFTSDWVTQFVPSWQKHVIPALAGRENVHWLEVGSFEGRSALWTLENVFTGSGSTITCVFLGNSFDGQVVRNGLIVTLHGSWLKRMSTSRGEQERNW